MFSEFNLGVFDFQDVLYGLVIYDVICLYKDVFVSWLELCVYVVLNCYWKKVIWVGILLLLSFEDFFCVSDLMGVQCYLKVIGIFVCICYCDGKLCYLGDVLCFFCYLEIVVVCCFELVELGELLVLLLQGVEV